ncbi:MAG: SAM-dependent methyltransferase, partial [Candidatus Scalindua sp.]|nr:SAM-dependent methyltransferase [Candidatus Scalindua sp.]
MDCRFCNTRIKHLFASLGHSPLSNSYLTKDELNKMEPFYPLEAYVCEKCFLVQLEEFESPRNIFSDYAYFSSYSDSWLKHVREYVNKIIDRFGFNSQSFV